MIFSRLHFHSTDWLLNTADNWLFDAGGERHNAEDLRVSTQHDKHSHQQHGYGAAASSAPTGG